MNRFAQNLPAPPLGPPQAFLQPFPQNPLHLHYHVQPPGVPGPQPLGIPPFQGLLGPAPPNQPVFPLGNPFFQAPQLNHVANPIYHVNNPWQNIALYNPNQAAVGPVPPQAQPGQAQLGPYPGAPPLHQAPQGPFPNAPLNVRPGAPVNLVRPAQGGLQQPQQNGRPQDCDFAVCVECETAQLIAAGQVTNCAGCPNKEILTLPDEGSKYFVPPCCFTGLHQTSFSDTVYLCTMCQETYKFQGNYKINGIEVHYLTGCALEEYHEAIQPPYKMTQAELKELDEAIAMWKAMAARSAAAVQ